MKKEIKKRTFAGESNGIPGETPIYGGNVYKEDKLFFDVSGIVVPRLPGPNSTHRKYIIIEVYCDFEGHGRASECWEEHVRLTLPQQQAWIRYTCGWWPAGYTGIMSFHGRTVKSVLLMTKLWIDEMYLQGFGQCIGKESLEESIEMANKYKIDTSKPRWWEKDKEHNLPYNENKWVR